MKINILKPFVLSLFLALLWSCSNDDANPPETEPALNIVETAQNTEILSNLVAALTTADENDNVSLVATLSSEGPFTVFAPSDDAFAALLNDLDGFDSLSDFDTEEERELLAAILSYHVIVGTAASSGDLSDGQTLTTAQGESLTVSLNGGVFIQDATEVDAAVTLADVETSNGIVHVIDKVLLPQAVIDALNEEGEEEEGDNLVDIVVAAESLTVLEAAVIKADLVATLSSEGPFTVFAPTDDAFVALLDALGDDYNSLDDFDTEAEISLLTDILLYHVLAAEVTSTDLAAGAVPTALQGESIEVIASGETFVIGDASDVDANLLDTDISASNGVAHVIDKVLLPPSAIDFLASLNLQNIVEIAVATDDLRILVEALQQPEEAGLVTTLEGEGPFTVFAPTNQAFADLLDALGAEYNSIADFDTAEEKDLLTTILTYHVIAGVAAQSTDLANGQVIETFQGESVTVVIDGETVLIDDATDTNATVTTANVIASNGVVHIVNKVLLPQVVVDSL
ncbi:MAG: fasciclin domain-containing protein [Flavobacteriaceae bacterium]|nr:fasciclin domain-containing protein [Flavobacteriaceae bacterium]